MQVESVADGGPADTAGIRVGDILLKYNDAELSSQADLRRALGRGEPGENVVLRVRRGEEELDVPVELGVQ
jgi:serine protease Do